MPLNLICQYPAERAILATEVGAASRNGNPQKNQKQKLPMLHNPHRSSTNNQTPKEPIKAQQEMLTKREGNNRKTAESQSGSAWC